MQSSLCVVMVYEYIIVFLIIYPAVLLIADRNIIMSDSLCVINSI